MVEIPLRRRDGTVRAWAIVDDIDADLLDGPRWCLWEGYAGRYVRADGTQRAVFLHRQLLGLERGDRRVADHINGDRLDNRRANLRAVSHRENCQNLRSEPGSSSRYRGVYWHTARGRWGTDVRIDGRNHHVGYFANERDAADAAARFRAEHMPYSLEGTQSRAA